MLELILGIVALYVFRVMYKNLENTIAMYKNLEETVIMLKKRNDFNIFAVDATHVEQVQAIVENYRKFGGNKTIEEFYSDMYCKSKAFDEFLQRGFPTIASYKMYKDLLFEHYGDLAALNRIRKTPPGDFCEGFVLERD